jgi:hypothetical protein
MTTSAQRLDEFRAVWGDVDVDRIDSRGIWLVLEVEPENAWDEPEPMVVIIPHDPKASRADLGLPEWER